MSPAVLGETPAGADRHSERELMDVYVGRVIVDNFRSWFAVTQTMADIHLATWAPVKEKWPAPGGWVLQGAEQTMGHGKLGCSRVFISWHDVKSVLRDGQDPTGTPRPDLEEELVRMPKQVGEPRTNEGGRPVGPGTWYRLCWKVRAQRGAAGAAHLDTVLLLLPLLSLVLNLNDLQLQLLLLQ